MAHFESNIHLSMSPISTQASGHRFGARGSREHNIIMHTSSDLPIRRGPLEEFLDAAQRVWHRDGRLSHRGDR